MSCKVIHTEHGFEIVWSSGAINADAAESIRIGETPLDDYEEGEWTPTIYVPTPFTSAEPNDE